MLLYTLLVPKRKKPPVKTWQPTQEDAQLLRDLREKLGINDPSIVRMGIRKLAESVLTHVDN